MTWLLAASIRSRFGGVETGSDLGVDRGGDEQAGSADSGYVAADRLNGGLRCTPLCVARIHRATVLAASSTNLVDILEHDNPEFVFRLWKNAMR